MRCVSISAVCLVVVLTGCTDSENADRAASTNGAADGDIPQIFEPTTSGSASVDGEFDRTNSVLTTADIMAAIELAPATVLDNKITIMMPVSMNQMNEEQLEAKYAGDTRPDLAFTDDSTTVNLTMSHTDTARTPGQIYEYHFIFKSMMQQSPVYKNAEWISNEEVTVDGRQCFLAQFRHHLADQEVYNMILGLSLDDRLMFVTFNFPTRSEKVWLNKGKEMLMTADFHDESERAPSATKPAE